AVGEAQIREHEGDALHRAVEPSAGDRGTDLVGAGGVADELDEGVAVLLVERRDGGVEGVGCGAGKRAVEQSERLEARLHLVHGTRRYRRRGTQRTRPTSIPGGNHPARTRPHRRGAASMANVVLDSVNKIYDNGFQAIHDLSLDIADGEFLVLVGPSGCGKSTALRMIAGLATITSGELKIGERTVNDV